MHDYVMGQRWTFECAVPEFEDTLLIVLAPGACVEMAGMGRFVPYSIFIRYRPESAPPGVTGVNLAVLAETLDSVVAELVESEVDVSDWSEFGSSSLSCRDIESGLRSSLQQHRLRQEGQQRIAAAMPKDEVLRLLDPWRESHRRDAWRPVVEKRDGKLTDSKFSGQAWLAPKETWPECATCQRPLQLLLQLDLSQLPMELAGCHGEGLLQLFYCVPSSIGECEDMRGFVPFAGPKLVRVVPPSELPRGRARPVPEDHFPPQAIVRWRRVDDYPDREELERLGLTHDQFDFARHTIRIRCGDLTFENQDVNLIDDISRALRKDKLRGWPSWYDRREHPPCPRCGQAMEVVFQLDSFDHLEMMFGDSGVGHITQCPQHRDVVTFAWAGG